MGDVLASTPVTTGHYILNRLTALIVHFHLFIKKKKKAILQKNRVPNV